MADIPNGSRRSAKNRTKRPAITIKVSGRQQQAIASALFHACKEFFDVTYEGPHGEPLSMERADERIFKLCRDRPPTAVIKVED